MGLTTLVSQRSQIAPGVNVGTAALGTYTTALYSGTLPAGSYTTPLTVVVTPAAQAACWHGPALHVVC
jgi:hypothetical protein